MSVYMDLDGLTGLGRGDFKTVSRVKFEHKGVTVEQIVLSPNDDGNAKIIWCRETVDVLTIVNVFGSKTNFLFHTHSLAHMGELIKQFDGYWELDKVDQPTVLGGK